MFEPGGFSNTALGSSRDEGKEDQFLADPSQASVYGEGMGKLFSAFAEIGPSTPGDVNKIPDVIVDVVKGEGYAKGRGTPLRVILGPDAMAVVRQKCHEQLALCDEWEPVSNQTVLDGWNGPVSARSVELCSMIQK